MKIFTAVSFLTVVLSSQVFSQQQPFYDVTYGNGNGLRLWASDSYKIHMGSGSEYFYGPVQDYSIKMNMSSGTPQRGWTWGVAGSTPIAAINTSGQMQIASSFTVGGDIIMPSVSGNKQIYTWSPGDMGWRIGMSLNPGFARSLATGHIEYLTYGAAAGQGFAVGVNGGNSSFEVQGSDHSAFFRGNVGIGAASSSSALTVKGAATAEETVVNVSNLSDQDFAVRLSAVGAAAKRTIIGPSTPTRLSLGVGVTSGNEYLTVVNGGNIGIGTTSPSTKLDLQGNGSTNVDLKVTGRIQSGDGANAGGMHVGTTGMFMGQVNANALGLWNNGAWRLVADNSGNIGVGVSSPSTRMDVQGNGGSTVDMKVNGRIQTGDVNNAGGMWVSSAGNLFVGQMGATALGFYNNGAWRLIADNNGNIGIGTSSPNQKLTVNGTIYGKEVKVDLNVPGPDYVFEKDYKLPSLDEIKSYIDQHKHLSEVPSAKEMEQNGINLSEMNMILLKKVEELTLIMIEERQRNEKAQSDLQNRIQQLENSIHEKK
jgi:hypothetical protein